MKKLTVLVCGGREYADLARVFDLLDRNKDRIGRLVQGGARGADRLAETWALDRRVECASYPAEWDRYGKRAGSMRNLEMLTDAKPDLVVAFPGGVGTADMIRRAKRAGVRVLEVLEPRGMRETPAK